MDLYYINNKEELIATIDSLESINNILDVFKSKTGLTIDEYDDTKLHLDHIKLLDKLITDDNDWKRVFSKAIEKQTGILILGN